MLCQFVPVLLAIAFMIYVERKTLAAVQRREGPSMVGPNGSLQSFIDGGKLIFKENIIPYKSNKIIFVSSSILMFCLSLLN
jgi:NADH-quinone oxidoreductase subunit H